METRAFRLLETLKEYYRNETHLRQLLDVILYENNADNISLRLLDWLVSNYSKSRNIVYYVDKVPFNMHQHYKNMLKAYSKKMFDPFRRHERIYIPYKNKSGEGSNTPMVLETTVAQLMFFKWAIENQVLDYAYKHRVAIKQDMDANTRHRTSTKQQTTSSSSQEPTARMKRKELSKPNKSVNMYRVNITVTFS
jgi:hypothetical protein